ncbi:MAG: hypothetical protein WB952_12540 [Terriglobales bacterium]
MATVKLPLVTSFFGGLVIFAGCAYGSYRLAIRVVYPRQQSGWFSLLDRREADRLRQLGESAFAYNYSVLSIQNTPSSLQINISNLAAIRKHAPEEMLPIIDLRLAKDYGMLARLEEQSGNAAAAADYRHRAGDLLRSLGWQDISDELLTVLADRQLQSRLKF